MEGNFVGMNMTRKFIQMCMTRVKRYANNKGRGKYDKTIGEELEKDTEQGDTKEKLEASDVFRRVWIGCKDQEGYQKRKEEFLKEQKECEKSRQN